MNRDQKASVVEEIAAQIEGAQAVFAVDYRGISVAQVADLRARLRESETRFRIVKNSLSERAADKAGAQSLKPMLEGPTALALVGGDAAVAAKALNDMARALNILEFKGGLMDGAALTADDVRAIARLPARDVLHAQLVGAIASPISGLVRTLNALISGIAIQLQAIVDMDPPALVSGEAPAAAAEPEAAAAEPEAAAPEPEAAAPESEAGAETEAAAEPEVAAKPEGEPTAEPEAAAEPEPEAAPQPEPDEPAQASEQPEADSTETYESEA